MRIETLVVFVVVLGIVAAAEIGTFDRSAKSKDRSQSDLSTDSKTRGRIRSVVCCAIIQDTTNIITTAAKGTTKVANTDTTRKVGTDTTPNMDTTRKVGTTPKVGTIQKWVLPKVVIRTATTDHTEAQILLKLTKRTITLPC
eukprot:Em0017g607a